MSASKAPIACLPYLRNCSLLLVQCCLAATVSAQHMAALDAAAGKALFERTWVTAPASTSAADGLGPYYDARSCSACHPAAGAGPVPDTLTVVMDDEVYGRQLQRRAVPGLPAEAAITFALHTDADPDAAQLAGMLPLQHRIALIDALQYGPLSSPVSLRRPPALAGVARFAEVSDSALQQLADPADRDGDGISGRVAGRYGWKAEVATMDSQIARAFSLDLGLGNPLFPAGAGDCTPAQDACLHHSANAVTGTALEVDQLVLDLVGKYLAALPAPPGSGIDNEGQQLFAAMGCQACHVAALATASEPLRAWSDLLLHDMGPGLAAGTNSPASVYQTMQPADPVTAGRATAGEWRTAPLWGLGQRQHFLHDGRATTLEQAILWHGGEAAGSRQRFIETAPGQRERLQTFLLGL